MRGYIAVLALILSGSAVAKDEGPLLVTNLDAYAAECRITGAMGDTQSFLTRRDHGDSSKAHKLAVEKAFKDSKQCVDANKAKGKAAFKEEAKKYLDLKDKMSDAYAAWVGYMDWMSIPHDISEDNSQEQIQYEKARNRLQAEIDLQ